MGHTYGNDVIPPRPAAMPTQLPGPAGGRGRGSLSSATVPGLKQGWSSHYPPETARPGPGRKGHCPSPQDTGAGRSRAVGNARGTDGHRRWHGTEESKPFWKQKQFWPRLWQNLSGWCPGSWHGAAKALGFPSRQECPVIPDKPP